MFCFYLKVFIKDESLLPYISGHGTKIIRVLFYIGLKFSESMATILKHVQDYTQYLCWNITLAYFTFISMG